MFDCGAAVDLRDYNIGGSIKLKFSDTGPIETFTARGLSDGGVNNVLELTLTEEQTTCLPISEAVYDVEIEHKTTKEVEKVLLGYFNIKPEVTRHASYCQASWSVLTTRGTTSSATVTSSSSSSSAASLGPCECFSAYIYRSLNTLTNTYRFTVEVPTNDVAMLGITHWEAELYMVDSKGRTTLHESELIDNNIDPSAARTGYEVIYPVGGSRHRFVDRAQLSVGNLVSIFTVPIPVSTFVSAQLKLRIFSPSCSIYGSDWLIITFDPALTETYGAICTSLSSSSVSPSSDSSASPSASSTTSPSPSPSVSSSSSGGGGGGY